MPCLHRLRPLYPVHLVRTLALLPLALAALAGQAGTAIERQAEAAAATAPHMRFQPSAKPVTVHYVHLKDEFQSSPTLQAGLRSLKQGIAICVEGNRRLGRPANPPAALPDQILRRHDFEYAAPNRSITYSMSYHVQMADDCSLLERATLTAKLQSSKGKCVIDLDRKTAEGICDAAGHADAPTRPRPANGAGPDAGMTALAADPRFAKQLAVLRQLPGAGSTVNGQRRTIAGVECRMVEGIPGVRGCVSQAGSFVPAVGAGIGMTLYREVAKDVSSAVEAKFDLPLDPAIFTPYLGGGFTITGKGGK